MSMNTEMILTIVAGALTALLTVGASMWIYFSEKRTKAREKAAELEYRKFSTAFDRITKLEKDAGVEKTHREYIQKNIEELKDTLTRLREDSSEESHITEEELNGLYFGPVGEA